jgi:hypothetical protein
MICMRGFLLVASSCYSRRVPTATPGFRSLALLALLALAGCGADSSPTAPSGGILQVLVSASVLRQGETATVSASQAGAPIAGVTWSTSDGTVATVSPAGVITARRPGRVTVTGTAGSVSGSTAVQVVPDFSGTWTGPLFRTQLSCAGTSTAAVCQPATTPEALLTPATFRLSQAGAVVTGTIVDGLDPLVVVAVQGRVAEDDILTLEGASVPATPGSASRQATISAFRATMDLARETITGTFSVTAGRVNAAGSLQFDHGFRAQFRDLPRR